ncbi:hypothetical protein VNO78_22026 [Psophocarpus tetragonolobus]|uniref:Uncharacterized protein n=1 Tax=Psophocarpus tetragonolobus TaxID=3891 RepID=A0AAN9SC10_PSOTE
MSAFWSLHYGLSCSNITSVMLLVTEINVNVNLLGRNSPRSSATEFTGSGQYMDYYPIEVVVSHASLVLRCNYYSWEPVKGE